MRGKFEVIRKRRDTGIEVQCAEYRYSDEQDRQQQEAKADVAAINHAGYVRETVDAECPQ